MEDTTLRSALSGLSEQDVELLINVLAERRNMSNSQQHPQQIPSIIRNNPSLPTWNGKQEDFRFYLDRLRIRVEKELAPCKESSSICLDIIDTIPEEKKSRIAPWFSECKIKNKFDWEDLLDRLFHEFEDNQAQQSAIEVVQRMEQGQNQYFHDFLKDFERKVAMSGGNEIYTPAMKTMQLKASLNSRLRRALVGVKLPPVHKYSEWVAEVKGVAAEIESFADYRQRGSRLTMTKIGPPKCGSAQQSFVPEEEIVDAEGDTLMTGTNAILAAIKDLKIYQKSSTKKKNCSEWRKT